VQQTLRAGRKIKRKKNEKPYCLRLFLKIEEKKKKKKRKKIWQNFFYFLLQFEVFFFVFRFFFLQSTCKQCDGRWEPRRKKTTSLDQDPTSWAAFSDPQPYFCVKGQMPLTLPSHTEETCSYSNVKADYLANEGQERPKRGHTLWPTFDYNALPVCDGSSLSFRVKENGN